MLEKFTDAASMFWQSLDFAEKRYATILGIYIAFFAFTMLWRAMKRWLARTVADELELVVEPEPS